MSLPEGETHRLTCHCDAVELEITLSDGFRSARRCDCSFCRRRGAMAVSVNKGDLRIVRGEENLTCYSFNTRTARHYFCRICGIYTHHKRRSNPDEYGVNAGAIAGVNPAELDPVPWNDGVNHPSDAQKSEP